MKQTKLSVIVPVHNEEEGIRQFLKEQLLKELDRITKYDYELILVNDVSTDNTLSIIQDFAQGNQQIKVISFSRNFGKESAIIAGLTEAKGDCAVVIDCDLQHPPEKIVEMYQKWQEGYDIVEGIKESRGKEGVIHKFGASLFYRIMSNAIKIDMRNTSDFKLLDKEAVRTLINMPEKNAFFRALSSWIGYETITIKYTVKERTEGESKWSFIKLVKYALSNITSFTTMPMQIITFLGIVILVVALVLTVIAVHDYVTGIALGGFTTVIILICFTSSVIMISLGIIGYYLSRIFEQVQDRPKYIISKKTRGEG